MNIKTILVAAILTFVIIPATTVNATALNYSLKRTASGVTHNEIDVRNFWYTWRVDEHSIDEMLGKGVYGFQYIEMDAVREPFTGITELGVEYPDEISPRWTVIFYLAESTTYDRSVFAINNGDGTATVFEPGEAPF